MLSQWFETAAWRLQEIAQATGPHSAACGLPLTSIPSYSLPVPTAGGTVRLSTRPGTLSRHRWRAARWRLDPPQARRPREAGTRRWSRGRIAGMETTAVISGGFLTTVSLIGLAGCRELQQIRLLASGGNSAEHPVVSTLAAIIHTTLSLMAAGESGRLEAVIWQQRHLRADAGRFVKRQCHRRTGTLVTTRVSGLIRLHRAMPAVAPGRGSPAADTTSGVQAVKPRRLPRH